MRFSCSISTQGSEAAAVALVTTQPCSPKQKGCTTLGPAVGQRLVSATECAPAPRTLGTSENGAAWRVAETGRQDMHAPDATMAVLGLAGCGNSCIHAGESIASFKAGLRLSVAAARSLVSVAVFQSSCVAARRARPPSVQQSLETGASHAAPRLPPRTPAQRPRQRRWQPLDLSTLTKLALAPQPFCLCRSPGGEGRG